MNELQNILTAAVFLSGICWWIWYEITRARREFKKLTATFDNDYAERYERMRKQFIRSRLLRSSRRLGIARSPLRTHYLS